jgi:quinol-cytochrome oxidoreductase complex cytochrome b subunit
MRAGNVRLNLPIRFAIVMACLLPLLVATGCWFTPLLSWGYPAGQEKWHWLLTPCIALSASVDGGPRMMEIIPPWYLLPTFAILRSVPWKLAGMIVAGAALLAPLLLGFFAWDKVPPRAWAMLLAVLVPCVYALAYLGTREPTDAGMRAGQALTLAYFAAFIVVFPLAARRGRSSG